MAIALLLTELRQIAGVRFNVAARKLLLPNGVTAKTAGSAKIRSSQPGETVVALPSVVPRRC
jgi:hypothetical protein